MKVKISGNHFLAQEKILPNGSLVWDIFNDKKNQNVDMPIGTLVLWPSKRYSFTANYLQAKMLQGYVNVEFIPTDNINKSYTKVTILSQTVEKWLFGESCYDLEPIQLCTSDKDVQSGIVCRWNVSDYVNQMHEIGIIYPN
jgi:hypothetical protein